MILVDALAGGTLKRNEVKLGGEVFEGVNKLTGTPNSASGFVKTTPDKPLRLRAPPAAFILCSNRTMNWPFSLDVVFKNSAASAVAQTEIWKLI
ncbi:MAG: hypothetical protein HZA50_08015 [Planctomycetes bacterium]|nr:hypothetical protein [Planctomycetota bacterium]